MAKKTRRLGDVISKSTNKAIDNLVNEVDDFGWRVNDFTMAQIERFASKVDKMLLRLLTRVQADFEKASAKVEKATKK